MVEFIIATTKKLIRLVAGICLIIIPAIFFSYCNTNRDQPAIETIHSDSKKLTRLTLPVKHVSTLEQCPRFVTIRDTLYFQHKTGDTISVFAVFSEQKKWKSTEVFKNFMPFDYAQLTPAGVFVAFMGYTPTIYQISTEGKVLNSFTIPPFFDEGLKDTVIQYIHGSVSLMPQNFHPIMPFRLYKRLIKQPKSLELAAKAKYNHNIFLAYNLDNPSKSKIFCSLSQLGFRYNQETEDDFNNMETKFTFNSLKDGFISVSSKQEKLKIINTSGDVIKEISYLYAANNPDFLLKANHDDPSEYYTQCSVYLNTWVDSLGQNIIRVLKRGPSESNQLDQTETPWEVVILGFNQTEAWVKHIYRFEPAHFNYSDIHFAGNKYLFISNRGLKNKYYEINNHSYSVLDISHSLN